MESSLEVTPDGLEPSTLRLEVTCSIQLSYGAEQRKNSVPSPRHVQGYVSAGGAASHIRRPLTSGREPLRRSRGSIRRVRCGRTVSRTSRARSGSPRTPGRMWCPLQQRVGEGGDRTGVHVYGMRHNHRLRSPCGRRGARDDTSLRAWFICRSIMACSSPALAG